MRYYLLNIKLGKDNRENCVDEWIAKNEYAPIFFGASTIKQISENKNHDLPALQHNDAKRFVDAFINFEEFEEKVIFAIGEQNVYVFKQKGPLTEGIHTNKHNINDNVKGAEIEILKSKPIKDVPLVLSSIKANRHLSSGTFRDISEDKYFGNYSAIQYLIDKKKITINKFDDYLRCLSSLELETLIAKIFEELGFFVPAYKGGFIKNYDLFVRNISGRPITVLGANIQDSHSISVQIKLVLEKRHINPMNKPDMFFCIKSEIAGGYIYDYAKIEELLKLTPKTSAWLRTDLYWVQYIKT